jgi:hypothetical protein
MFLDCDHMSLFVQALFALLAAFAASFAYLFTVLTGISQGRRRKRMAEDGPLIDANVPWWSEYLNRMADFYWHGASSYSRVVMDKSARI